MIFLKEVSYKIPKIFISSPNIDQTKGQSNEMRIIIKKVLKNAEKRKYFFKWCVL